MESIKHAYTAKECPDAFCARMNEKAKELSMLCSDFTDPSGITNHSNTHDIMQLLFAARQNDAIWKVLTTDEYTVNIEGQNSRQYSFTSKTRLGINYQCLRDHYDLLSGKGGALHKPHIYNLASVIRAP